MNDDYDFPMLCLLDTIDVACMNVNLKIYIYTDHSPVTSINTRQMCYLVVVNFCRGKHNLIIRRQLPSDRNICLTSAFYFSTQISQLYGRSA